MEDATHTNDISTPDWVREKLEQAERSGNWSPVFTFDIYKFYEPAPEETAPRYIYMRKDDHANVVEGHPQRPDMVYNPDQRARSERATKGVSDT